MTTKKYELLNLIIDHVKITKVDLPEGKFDFPEGEQKFSSKMIPIVLDYLKEKNPKSCKDVEDHFGKPMGEIFNSEKCMVAPFGVLFLACDKISVNQFLTTLLKAPKDAEVIPGFVEEKDFKDILFSCYDILDNFKKDTTVSDAKVSGIKLTKLEDYQEKTLNTLLENFHQPKWKDILTAFKSVEDVSSSIDNLKAAFKLQEEEFEKDKKEFKAKVTKLTKELSSKSFKNVKVPADTKIPEGKVVLKKVKDVFPGIKANLEIPVWEWAGPHPEVPAVDENYIFREDLLMRALYAILSNERMYLQGHTGSGKTTLVEQIAARLNWPFARINFDSEITRMDLIGRDTLKDGASVFVDGVLPRLMSGPYIAVFDEIDFCRPDVAYVMQSVLEGNSFRITEDGGRLVEPHQMFRMFATGNTVGQGDEEGMYQGARPQSLAFLDRFTIWAKVEYLDSDQRKNLLEKSVPALVDKELTTIIKYTDEHLNAFTNAKVLQPISPRGIQAIGRAVNHFNAMYPKDTGNIRRALNMVVLDRASSSDRAVLLEIIDRVCK